MDQCLSSTKGTATTTAAPRTIKIDRRSQFDLMKQQPIGEHITGLLAQHP